MKPFNGGPAFPNPSGDDRDNNGMTLRDWFAGKEQVSDSDDLPWEICEALAGKRPDGNWATNGIAWLEWEATWRARIRYIRADAMLKAREAKP